MDSKDNLIGVFSSLLRWRRAILGLAAACAVLTAGISLFLPNYYQSTTVFLAANPDQARPDVLFGRSGGYLYGGGGDIDRLLTLAESNELADYMVEKFDLYEHYQINPKLRDARELVRKRFTKLFEVKKTKRDAIELSIEDQDAELAATMANTAREKINLMAQEVIKAGQRKTIASYEQSINQKIAQMNKMGDSLVGLRSKYRIYNTREQSTVLTERFAYAQTSYFRARGRYEAMRKNPQISRDSVAYAQANMNGYKAEVDSLARELAVFNVGQVNLMLIETQYFTSNGVIGDELEKVRLLRSALQAEVPSIYVLEPAEPAVVKSRPKRSLLVVLAGALGFFVAVIGVLLIESYQHINWREMLRGE